MARATLFNLINQGVATAATTEQWIDLGTITSGSKAWFGYADYMPDGKNCTFQLRSNLAGKSAGTTGDTTLHGSITAKDLTTMSADYYKNGRIVTKSVQSTGVEKMWLRITAKANSSCDNYWWIYYTLS